MEAHTERLIERGLLFDYYGGLLNEKNKRIYEAAAVEDMSLTEISEEMGISRQAVSDSLKRIDTKLQGYEKELALIKKSRILEDCAGEIRDVLYGADPEKAGLLTGSDIARIEDILTRIEEL